MVVIVIPTPNFQKEAKKLLKKYRSLKNELKDLSKSLQINPYQGDKITENTYKIRVAVKSKGKGKRAGLRVVTYVYLKLINEITEVYLVSIYDKSDFESVSQKFISQITEEIQQEIEEEKSKDKKDGDSPE